ncbi:uncharacterized protein LOC144717296 isoform X2 [Lampetra planeri]
MAFTVATLVLEPNGDFPEWLEAQGVNAEVARAMDSELGIRDYGVLRACVGDGIVQAELLATARDRLPFGFYAVLRQVVKDLHGAELHDARMPHLDDAAASSASPGDVMLGGLVDVLVALFSGLSSELLMSVKRLGAMDGLKYEMPSSGDAIGNEMMMAEMDRPMENGERAGTQPPDADDSQPNLPVDRIKMKPFGGETEDVNDSQSDLPVVLIKNESFEGETEEMPTPDVDDSQSDLPVEPFIDAAEFTENAMLPRTWGHDYKKLSSNTIFAMTSQQIEDEGCTLAVETAPAPWAHEAQDAIQNGEAASTCTRKYVSLPPTEGFSFESVVASRNGLPLAAVARSLTIGDGGSNNPGVLPGCVVQKPYRCEVCGHCFLKREYLNIHLRTHTGEKPYCCKVCGQTFSNQSNLKRHHFKHTGEKPYGCEICGRAFSQSYSMKMHMRMHTGEKPYQCDVCGKAFTHGSRLRQHQRIHRGSGATTA